jgi:hypothetical protein
MLINMPTPLLGLCNDNFRRQVISYYFLLLLRWVKLYICLGITRDGNSWNILLLFSLPSRLSLPRLVCPTI